jgi:hypothetical protein
MSGVRAVLFLSGLAAVLVGTGGCGAGGSDGADGGDEAALHEPCCTDDAQQCDYPNCGADLICYVLPHAMYEEIGICCRSASCTLPCDGGICNGTCEAGEAGCPELLTCRNANTSSYCLP